MNATPPTGDALRPESEIREIHDLFERVLLHPLFNEMVGDDPTTIGTMTACAAVLCWALRHDSGFDVPIAAMRDIDRQLTDPDRRRQAIRELNRRNDDG